MNGKKFRTQSTIHNYGWEMSLGRQQELSRRGACNAICRGLWAPSGRQWRVSERSWVLEPAHSDHNYFSCGFLDACFLGWDMLLDKKSSHFCLLEMPSPFPEWIPFTVMIGPNVAWKNCHCTGGDLFQSVSHSLFLLEMWIFMLWTFHDAIKTLIVIIYRR